MKRIGLLFSLLALLTACSVEDDDSNAEYMYGNDSVVPQALYDGEWTVNKQVVDTARLEVNGVLKVRLPEDYLTRLCFAELSSVTSEKAETMTVLKGQPAVIHFTDQGYTTTTSFANIGVAESSLNGVVMFSHASFTVALNGVDYRMELLSKEPGTAVYRNDTGLWTIAIPVGAFLVTNLNTQEESEHQLPSAVTIYYNAKKRIR